MKQRCLGCSHGNNSRASDDKGQSIQRLKQTFLCNLWEWSNLFIVLRIHTVVDFVNWIGAH